MANQYINKFVKDGVTKFDLTSDTVTPKTLKSGYTAHNAAGQKITGTLLSQSTTVTASTLKSGYTAYNQAGTRITGTLLSQNTTATADKILKGYTAYNRAGNLMTGTAKQAGNVDLSADSVTVSSASPTATVKSSNATGTVSISTIGDGFTATLSGNTITITRIGVEQNIGYIRVDVAESSSAYSAYRIINVIVSGITFCTWANGTDEQVAAMIQAAQAGEITLTDYWSAGDKRIVNNRDKSILKDDIFELILSDGMTYTTTDGETKTSNFKILILQFKSIAAMGTEGNPLGYIEKKQWGTTYYTAQPCFTRAQEILNCIPISLSELVIEQKWTDDNNNVQNTKAIYGGDFLNEVYSGNTAIGNHFSNNVYGKITSLSNLTIIARYRNNNSYIVTSREITGSTTGGVISVLLI